MNRPRITAYACPPTVMHHRAMDASAYVTPRVEVRVDYDLHDHDDALRVLDAVIADIRSQIEAAR